MTAFRREYLVLAVLCLMFGNPELRAQEEPLCVENSPERRGEIGCSIVETKLLPAELKEPVFWHIDRFDNGELARAAVGPTSIAFEAHGAWWLMSVSVESKDHHGGEHVAEVKLSPLSPPRRYSMRVLSAYIPAGMTSRVHVHSGAEAIYTVDGEQCVETEKRAIKIERGPERSASDGCHDATRGCGRKASTRVRGNRVRLIHASNGEAAHGKLLKTCFLYKMNFCLWKDPV